MFFLIVLHELGQRPACLKRHGIIGGSAAAADQTVTADTDKACCLGLSHKIFFQLSVSQIKGNIHLAAVSLLGMADVKTAAVVNSVVDNWSFSGVLGRNGFYASMLLDPVQGFVDM